MYREDISDRISNQIRTMLQANLKTYSRHPALPAAIDDAVRSCVTDAPHGGQVGTDPTKILTIRLVARVKEVLVRTAVGAELIDQLTSEVEGVVTNAIMAAPKT